MQRRIWNLMCKQNRTENETLLLEAMVFLLDLMIEREHEQFSVGIHTLKQQLDRMEGTLTKMDDSVKRLQDNDAAIEAGVADIQTTLQSFQQAVADAEARLQADIDSLRNTSGSGDPAAIDAVADSLQNTLGTLTTLKNQLAAATSAQAGIDTGSGGGSGSEPTLSVSPSTVTVLRGNQTTFTANIQGCLFAAVSGSFDSNTPGLYTPPTDAGVTSDTVTVTSPGGQTATASVTIAG